MATAQIVEPMYELTGYQKTNLQFILTKLGDCIRMALEKSDTLQLNGIGTFSIQKRKARVGRNPQSGAKISIPSSKAPAFVPGINLKKAVKGK